MRWSNNHLSVDVIVIENDSKGAILNESKISL